MDATVLQQVFVHEKPFVTSCAPVLFVDAQLCLGGKTHSAAIKIALKLLILLALRFAPDHFLFLGSPLFLALLGRHLGLIPIVTTVKFVDWQHPSSQSGTLT